MIQVNWRDDMTQLVLRRCRCVVDRHIILLIIKHPKAIIDHVLVVMSQLSDADPC
jgi:hypothetical protein